MKPLPDEQVVRNTVVTLNSMVDAINLGARASPISSWA